VSYDKEYPKFRSLTYEGGNQQQENDEVSFEGLVETKSKNPQIRK
jgi:hypothetical protein